MTSGIQPGGKSLGFGFIGAGAIAHFHARAVAASNGGVGLGVVSRSRATAEKFAAEHGLGFAGDDVDALLKQPGIDAVCITTPSALHLQPALAAIRAGKHLMIEKPLDSTVEGTDHILHEAEKHGVRVGSIFQARFGDAARQIKAAIDAGRFGRMVLASCYVKWNRTTEYYTGWKGKLSEDGGGVIINQAIHGVDLLQWFAGMPVEVFAWATQRVHQIESEDTCVAALEVRQRRLRHHRRHHGHLAGLVAAHRDLRRERFGRDGRRRHLALGFPRREARGCEDPRHARERGHGFGRRGAHEHQDRGARAPDPGFHRRHQRRSARSSSKARRRARPWRWCAPSMIPRPRAAPCDRTARDARGCLAGGSRCCPRWALRRIRVPTGSPNYPR